MSKSSIRNAVKRIVPKRIRTSVRHYRLIKKHKAIAASEGREYLFSIVVPVYNCEQYLDETIKSLMDQTIGFDQIEVILVNDGSTDNSAEICRKYASAHKNVLLFEQENKGVSAARNTGLDHCHGLYINFLDSDDKWGKNSFLQTLSFFNKFPSVKVAAAKERFFGAEKGNHPRNFIFETDRIVDLEKEYYCFPIAAPQTFFRYDSIGDIRFFVGLLHSEDGRFTSEVVMQTLSFGAMKRPTYYYRKRKEAGSATNNIAQTDHYYDDAITFYHDYLIKESIERFGGVKQFIQYSLAYNISWRIKDKALKELDPEKASAYEQRLRNVLEYIDDNIVAAQTHLTIYQRVNMLCVKYDIPFRDMLDNMSIDKHNRLVCNKDQKAVFDGGFETISRLRIQFIKKKNATLIIEGRANNAYINENQMSIVLACNDKKYPAEIYPRKHEKLFMPFEKDSVTQLHFRIEVPVSSNMEMSFFVSIFGSDYMKPTIMYEIYCGLNERYPDSSYWLHDGLLFSLDGDSIIVSDNFTQAEIEEKETLYQKRMAEKNAKKVWLDYRNRALEARKNSTEKLWIFTDRMTSAEDSGEFMFRYVNEHPIPGVKTVFLIRDDVPDYERLKQYGTVLPFGGVEHRMALLTADKLISSAADAPIMNPFGKGVHYVKDIMDYDFVFLQHGVIKDDLSNWLHRANKNIKLFVTSAEREKEAVLSDPYGYTDDEVILTGLPRFDNLTNPTVERNKSIFIMPTWRQWLAPAFNINAKNASDIQKKRNGFLDSDYFKNYNGLLSNERLHKLLRQYGYKVFFALHPRMGAEMDSFYHDDDVILLKPESFVYGDAFKSMDMLITDYSSVSFNVGLLKKPIVYFQFDYDEFYGSGKHTSTEGYFSFENDGFGPVLKDVEDVVDYIETALKSCFVMDREYMNRVNDFFYYPPEGESRCSLITKKILELNGDH